MNRKMKFIVLMTAMMASWTCFSACGNPRRYDYGVFLGVDEINAAALSQYDLLVIDAASVEKNQIAELREKGTAVYSYLNIGTVETYRDYYEYFLDLGLLLDVYEDWPDERFIDVSDARWQDYAVNTIAADLTKQGIDGFFLDNFDVYYNYGESPAFLSGLTAILQGLKDHYNLPVMINGGDVAVKEIIKTHPGLIDAVNQECVFTGIDFENDKPTAQDADATQYYKDYLNECKQCAIDIYLLEYGGKVPERIIKNYCAENGFKYYVSKNLDLTEPQY